VLFLNTLVRRKVRAKLALRELVQQSMGEEDSWSSGYGSDEGTQVDLLNKSLTDENGNPRDVLVEFPELGRFRKNGLRAKLFCHSSDDLTDRDYEQLMELLERNMASQYRESSWGWDRAKKMNELRDEDIRVITIVGDDNSLLGFSSFKFSQEDDAIVLYVHEFQISGHVARKGLGQHLMNLLERVARFWRMDWIMLTIFNANTVARSFYESQGFIRDSTSPELGDHQIMSKKLFEGVEAVDSSSENSEDM